MKKIFGLLAVCALVACNESGENGVSAPVNGYQQNQQNQNAQVNTDSIRQHVADSIAALYGQGTMSSAVVGQSSAVVQSSSAIVASSSSAIVASSSSTIVASSSSAAVVSSSSKAAPVSSAAVEVDDGTIKLELWDGTKAHVPVGNTKGGWWYTYDDNESSGASVIAWKAEPGADGDMAPVIEACGTGVCGTFTLDQGDYEWDPFVGFAFGFGANNSFSGDASALGGICVKYYSDSDILLELGLTNAREKKIGYANPFTTLAASGSEKTVNLTWASFKQPSWYTEDDSKTVFINGTEASSELSSLKFKITGTSGDSGEFGVLQVGPKGACK